MLLPVYRIATHLAHRVPLGSGSLAKALSGRRESASRWPRWAHAHRGSGQLVWIHAASVGEALTAAPLVIRLRSAHPEIQVVHSYSSPSAENWPAPFHRDYADFVPLDLPRHVSQVLDAVQPSVIVFSRGDLWPELVAQAASRDIPIAVIGASVRPDSLRLKPLVRPLYTKMLQAVSWVGAATSADARRWSQLGAPQERVTVTGDPRHDQVLERITDISRISALRDWAAGGPTLIGGSAEPSDERALLAAASRVLSTQERARLLVVPHAPDEQCVERWVALGKSDGLEAEPWTPEQRDAPTARYVVLNARGMLFDLYAVGSLAYVGGGFRPGKLHATVEPAVYGLPVVIGPHWEGTPDAEALVRVGGAETLPPRKPGNAFAETWLRWLADEEAASNAGLAARQSLAQGAATLSVQRLLALLDAADYGSTITPS